MTSPNDTVLALDGGGTKTFAILVRRDGTLAGLWRTPGINPFDGPAWRQTLTDLLHDLPRDICAAALGLPGYQESNLTSTEQADVVRCCLSVRTTLMNDVEMACAGAFAGRPGILLLSGTGSMAWKIGADGSSTHTGGWGALFGDEGSAHWVGREILGTLSQALDGRTVLPAGDVEALLRLVEGPGDAAPGNALLTWYANLTAPRAQLAALAEGVDRLALDGCRTAGQVLDAAADELARQLEVLLRTEAAPWSYAGSLFRCQRILERLTARFGTPWTPLLPPVGGGAIRAAALAGWHIDDTWNARLGRALRDEGIF